MTYWLIKTILILGLLLGAAAMLRPVRSTSHLALRRIGFLLVLLGAGFAVIFPDVLHRTARALGVHSGVNLLVYILFLMVLAQMAVAYRRDLATERKITALARAVALQSAPKPPAEPMSD